MSVGSNGGSLMKLFVSDINKVISYNCSHFLCVFFGLAEIVVKLILTDLFVEFSLYSVKRVWPTSLSLCHLEVP